MAELLTALVNHHQGMCAAMMPMKGMMTEKGGSGAHDSHK
jgi:hypothetical protein